ncbi:MAG: LytR/AlgR family response regulator transcription factor [Crocinitomicaceae bacterium]
MTEKLRAIIIEDESQSRDILKQYLTKYCQDVLLEGEAANINEGEVLISATKPQLVFLDIEMPFGSGFDLLERLPQINFEVVFITAYSDYAIQALNISAAYYILKPIAIDDLVNAVDKVKMKLEEGSNSFSSTKLLAENIKAIHQQSQKMVLPKMDGFDVVKIADIIRVEAADNYAIVHAIGNKKYVISKTLKHYEDLLTDFGFLRSHKSHLVNLRHIIKYKKGKTGELFLIEDHKALVSTSSKKALMAYFAG